MFDANKTEQNDEPPQGLSTTKKFTVELLGKDDIHNFLLLQKKAWQALPEDKKHYLKIRTRKDLLNHMGYRMPIIGVKDEDGILVGQCLLSYPSNQDGVKNVAGYPIHGKETTTAIIQSLAVDPNIRGYKLSYLLIEAVKDMAAMTGHVALLAKVAQDNEPSTKSFMGAAFAKAAEGLDPVKGYAVNYWQYNLYQGCGATPEFVAK